jgi:hypothetical protein
MLNSKRYKSSTLSVRSAEVRMQSLSALQSKEVEETAVDLVLVGKKHRSIPVLKLNFDDPLSMVSVTNHASHSSHASHASHHSRHR